MLDPHNLAATEAAWLSACIPLIGKYRDVSLLVSAAYAEALGFIHGSALALDASRVVTSLRVTGPVAVKIATRAGEGLSRASEIGRSLSLGSSSRMVLDAGRDAVRLGSVKDPEVRGWKRVGDGDCDFCRMLIGRGAVYSKESVQFDSHDNCKCVPEPVFP